MVQLAMLSAATASVSSAPAVPSKSNSADCPDVGEILAEEPILTRPIDPIDPPLYPVGGTTKSAALTAWPNGVTTRIFPELACAGTAVESVADVAAPTVAQDWLNCSPLLSRAL